MSGLLHPQAGPKKAQALETAQLTPASLRKGHSLSQFRACMPCVATLPTEPCLNLLSFLCCLTGEERTMWRVS